MLHGDLRPAARLLLQSQLSRRAPGICTRAPPWAASRSLTHAWASPHRPLAVRSAWHTVRLSVPWVNADPAYV